MAPIKSTFSETQKFNQPWLWIILIVIYISPIIPNISTIINQGFSAAFNIGILNHIITIGVVIILFLWMRLETKLTPTGIALRYVPFLKKEITWEEIERLETVNYSFKDVLGWGIRLGSRYGTVYNVRGYDGLLVTLKNGKQFLIGTQQVDALRKIINAN